MRRSILVTGGAGFIGTRLVERLQRSGDKISVLDARLEPALGWNRCVQILGASRVIRGNVCSPREVLRAFDRSQPDVVLHLAAQSHVDDSIARPMQTLESNVIGTHVIASQCAKNSVPLVYCSTDEVYGDACGRKPSVESDSLLPSSPYSASKASGELVVRAVARTYGLKYAITRGTNAFGPGQYAQKLIPIACRLLAQGKRVQLHGGGEQIRQWIHVDEFAEGLELVARGLVRDGVGVVGGTFNLAGPVRLSVRSLVEMLADRAGISRARAHRSVTGRPGGDIEYNVDGSFSKSVLGFEPSRKITDPNELDDLISVYRKDTFVDVAMYGAAK